MLGIILGGIVSVYYFQSQVVPNAYSSGITLGETQGYEKGYQQGEIAGNTTGFQFGFTKGFDNGQEEGYSTGYSTGYGKGDSVGYNRGYTKGYDGGYSTGNSTGYTKGINDLAKSGFTTRNPTYSEAMVFVQSNQVDKNIYNTDSYTCYDFTADFIDAALKIGYRAGFVYIELKEGAHAIVCFNTTDRGVIYIEPQSDEQVSLEVGKPYWNRAKYLPPTHNDTILDFGIIW
jgi:hypothetical protein